MPDTQFQGDRKLPLKSPLAKVERRFIDANVAKFPLWIEGYHLTLMTVLWSAGILIFGYRARTNLNWLWLSSLILLLVVVFRTPKHIWQVDMADKGGRACPFRE